MQDCGDRHCHSGQRLPIDLHSERYNTAAVGECNIGEAWMRHSVNMDPFAWSAGSRQPTPAEEQQGETCVVGFRLIHAAHSHRIQHTGQYNINNYRSMIFINTIKGEMYVDIFLMHCTNTIALLLCLSGVFPFLLTKPWKSAFKLKIIYHDNYRY